MSFVSIFTTAIAPIIAIGAVGYALGRAKGLDTGPLNTVTVYVFAPALVFHSLATTTLDGETILKLSVGVTVFVLLMLGIAAVVGRYATDGEPLFGAFLLTCAFANCGNFGIPLSTFAFGEVGRSTAVLYTAVQNVVMYTVGVFIAARSGGNDPTEGVKHVFAIPLVYAVVAAIGLRWLGVLPPADSSAMETLRLVGDSAIPLMLLMLGSELTGTDVRTAVGSVGAVNVLKLLVAPVVAVGVVLLLAPANQTAARVFVLECATPVAVTPLILLLEFGPETDGLSGAEFVSATVLTSTLLSIPTLTALIVLLQSGALV
ncbi:AEC family transporter [Halomarina ordinaria]|uniref:AEC family transporter n=1 Tax=Halomarina ordinaria TaxID=3033939 RepID=A0ABD5UB42_9EURY|nr:AEC family transporter [Halomarina sp. PSRA2]